MNRNRDTTRLLTTGALFAGLTFLFTLTGAVFPIGGGAYIHIGDAVIYLSALVLPLPFALPAAALGAGLADLTLGSAVYILPTVIIKCLVVLTAKGFLKLSSKPLVQDMLVCLSGAVTIAGYYVAEVIILLMGGSSLIPALTTAAADSILFNFLQALASAAVYIFAAGAVRSIMEKRKNKPVPDEPETETETESETEPETETETETETEPETDTTDKDE